MSETTARTRLDRAAIVAAALDLLDAVGLEALSTRSLATALGVKGPSLYWHVRNMSELRDLMAEALLDGALPDPDAPGHWRDWLADGARGIRRMALSRRDGARLLAASRPTERRIQRFAPNITRLQAAGFGPEAARAAFLVLNRYALGSALGEQASDSNSQGHERLFEHGLGALIDGLTLRPWPTGPKGAA